MVNIMKIKRWFEDPQKVKYGTVVEETVVKGLILEGILVERFMNEKTVVKGSTVEDTVDKKTFLKHCVSYFWICSFMFKQLKAEKMTMIKQPAVLSQPNKHNEIFFIS